MSQAERTRLISNLVNAMRTVPREIQERQIVGVNVPKARDR
jgi:hypothetical protein